ncbi:glycosyltransferase family 2 protein [Candidatus Berkelbacteria bacterium]|nr:glycosyltransferase family 2 protein [Candidatus Berkelbacteria bacterium]
MKLAIIIPAYNEGKVINQVIHSLPKSLERISKIDIVVVNDGSTDHTAEEAKQAGAKVLNHPINSGVGIAKKTLLKAGQKLNADVVVTMDADGQHSPDDLPNLIKPIIDNEADIVAGSRLINPNGMPIFRHRLNQLMNLLLKLLSKIDITDSQSGYRAYNQSALKKLQLKTSGFEIDTEILIAAKRANLRMTEVPIKTIYTDYSKSKGQSITTSITTFIRLITKLITG